MKQSEAFQQFRDAAKERFNDLSEADAIFRFSELPEARDLYRQYREAELDAPQAPK